MQEAQVGEERNGWRKLHHNKIEELNRSITIVKQSEDTIQKQWESDRADKVKMLRDVQTEKDDLESTKRTLQGVKDSLQGSENRMVDFETRLEKDENMRKALQDVQPANDEPADTLDLIEMVKKVYTNQFDKMQGKVSRSKYELTKVKNELANKVDVLKDEFEKADKKLALVSSAPAGNPSTPAPAASPSQGAAAAGGPTPPTVPRPIQDLVDSIRKDYRDSED